MVGKRDGAKLLTSCPGSERKRKQYKSLFPFSAWGAGNVSPFPHVSCYTEFLS
jgi:hypothetical protein